MPVYDFAKVRAVARRTFVCEVCGKRGARSRTFWRTVNPFNTNPDGSPKTTLQVRDDVRAEADQWQPTRHAKCEGGA